MNAVISNLDTDLLHQENFVGAELEKVCLLCTNKPHL